MGLLLLLLLLFVWLIFVPLVSPQVRSFDRDALSDLDDKIGANVEEELTPIPARLKHTPKCWGWEETCSSFEPSECGADFTTSKNPSIPSKYFHNTVDWGKGISKIVVFVLFLCVCVITLICVWMFILPMLTP